MLGELINLYHWGGRHSMELLTLALFFVGCAQVFVYFRQAKIMEKQAELTRETIKISREAIDASKESFERQLRAYIRVDKASHQSNDFYAAARVSAYAGHIHKFTIEIKNTGQTPANDIHLCGNCCVLPFPLPENFDFPSERTYQESFPSLANGLSYQLIVPSADFGPQEEKLSALEIKEKAIYAYGEISYKDVFNKTWRTEFCYHFFAHILAPSKTAVAVDQHNNVT